MIYLFLAAFCSTCLLLILKYVQKHSMDRLPVIVVNYFVCGVVGYLIAEEQMSIASLPEKAWLPHALLLGTLFITVFYMVAVSTETNGVAITAVAFKLSVVIPVIAAYFLYGDQFTPMKIAGIILAAAAILLTSKEDKSQSPKAKGRGLTALFPPLVFIGSGFCDSLFNYIQATLLPEADYNFFLIIVFGIAGVGGLIALIIKTIRTKKLPLWKEFIMGIVLGVPNYGSAYFLILALEKSGFESSALFPLNNIAIILLSTLLAAVLFKERINKYGIAGIALAVISIVLIASA